MNKNSLRFAFAVNHDSQFEDKHFGNADKYLIYELTDNEFIFIGEESNNFNSFDDEKSDGFSNKGMACINLLEKNSIKVLVSRQFGKNIQMVNRYFIPVIVSSESPDDVVTILKKHMRWIEDELNSNTEEFKLFSIKKGILKTSISKDK